MVGALQCKFIRDFVLLLRNRAPLYFFFHSHRPNSWELRVLGTALETEAPLAGVLLYQCADSGVSVLWQSVQVLSVSSTQQELEVVVEA